jgi:hypothetical protein
MINLQSKTHYGLLNEMCLKCGPTRKNFTHIEIRDNERKQDN